MIEQFYVVKIATNASKTVVLGETILYLNQVPKGIGYEVIHEGQNFLPNQ